MALQSLDIERRSATTTPPPGAREQPQVAKLLDVSRCIGCKACQVACQEWNDLRSESRPQRRRAGQSARPRRAQLDGDALCRGRAGGRQPRVADPQGRLHALRGPGLPEGVPGAGRHRAVLQRHRGLPPGALHRLRLLRGRLPVRRPAHLEEGQQGLQVHALLRPGRGRARAGLREVLPDGLDHVRHQGGHDPPGRGTRRGTPGSGASPTPGCTTRKASAALTSCTCCRTPTGPRTTAACRGTRRSPRPSGRGRGR